MRRALSTIGPIEVIPASTDRIDANVKTIVDLRWPHHSDADVTHAHDQVERMLRRLADGELGFEPPDGAADKSAAAAATDTDTDTKATTTAKPARKRKTTKAATQQKPLDVQYVFVSSALVFGAWSNNALPISDDATVSPNPDAGVFVSLAKTEQMLIDFANTNAWFRLSILRPALIVDGDLEAWTYPELAGLGGVDALYPERLVQYVALADVATAVSAVVLDQLAGTFNVGPADWLTVREARDIAGGIPAIDLPASVSRAVVGPARAFGVLRTAPAYEPYLTDGVVVASDGLRRAGWTPQMSCAEALVASVKASWWSELTPKRRQELALGAVAIGVLGGVGLAVGVWLRRRK
jgi:hypothetical protein